MLKNKKGFTLIELLAVIVILAIIALIAVPIILGVIEKAEKGAAKASALGYIDAVEKQIMINQMDNDATNDIVDGNYTVNGDNIVKDSTNIEVKVKGKPVTGSFTISDGQVTTVDLEVGKYTVTGNTQDNTIEVTTGEDSEDSGSSKMMTEIISETTYRVNNVKNNNERKVEDSEYIIYLDPTDLTKTTCNSENSDSRTGRTTGCMKWYYIGESNGKKNFILDHNTTVPIAWNSTGNKSEMKEVQEKLNELKSKNGSNWKIEPRLITADEVATITGNSKFSSNASTYDKWFYFDTNTNSASTTCTEGNTAGCSYGWLYDRTNINCENYGCPKNAVSETKECGYWTSTPIFNSSSGAWDVDYKGYLDFSGVSNEKYYGVRPVISF